jgi:hypothetical protein
MGTLLATLKAKMMGKAMGLRPARVKLREQV